jgi:hypothetical protein
MGKVGMIDVSKFSRLRRKPRTAKFQFVYIDLEEDPRYTPRYESRFMRSTVEDAGARVSNGF